MNMLRAYGADVDVLKYECINHISKWMYKGLESTVK